MTDLTNPIFNDVDAARAHLEAVRWPDGPYCPHCGDTENTRKLKGKSHRPGLHYCRSCRKQFTVTVGTLFERSPIPLHKWVMASYLLCASKKGISSHQLHRMLGVTYKTAWFMTHRIREAMKDDNPEPMGGEGSAVQADETYLGTVDNPRTMRTDGRPFTKSGKSGLSNKRVIVTLISRGKARSFHVKHATAKTVRQILVTNAHRDSELHTDESRLYTRVGEEFKAHKTVNHSRGQYVGPSGATTNNAENFFSIFKRGMKGIYQHCGEQHLKRYLTEFDFRYNHREIDDSERAIEALKGISGKRLTYRRIGERAVSEA